ncbi:hypothetical protein PG997_002471 [Apiospora hydei]|uniref:YMC020W-like alpha/beta hydrolase domain-containing protein n=1 Tax=Apiospora hydei TaxID=1337664 RepID=A0ABR1X9G4_9PEZI
MASRKRPRPNPPESTAANTTSLPVSLVSRLTGSTRRDRSSSQPNDPTASTASSTLSSTTAASSSSQDASQPSQMQREATDDPPAPPKSNPNIYQTATEEPELSIMGGTVKGAPADFSRYDTKKSSDTSGDSDRQSIKTLTKTTDSESQPNGNDTKKSGTESTASTVREGETENAATQEPSQGAPEASLSPTVAAPSEQPATSSGWLGWLGGYVITQGNAQTNNEETNKTPAPTQVPATVTQQETTMPPQDEISQTEPATPNQIRPTNSWFGGWLGTSVITNNEPSKTNPTQSEDPNKKEVEVTVTDEAPPTSTDHVTSPAAGSTWAFWSRDTGSKANGKTVTSQEQGELAVMGDGSESSPQRSAGVDARKRARPEAIGVEETGPARPETPTNKLVPAKPETPTSVQSVAPPNLLLPAFRHTYQMQQNPSILKQITQLLLRTQQPPPRHVYLVKEPPRIKKAMAIGVHGLFPAAFLRPMIGQPTGTSLRFANHAADAIRRWTDSHGCADCEIEKVALEGDGKIGDRVDNLWTLLLNWIDHIRSADFILLACHSQGVPVGVMLAAKLLS